MDSNPVIGIENLETNERLAMKTMVSCEFNIRSGNLRNYIRTSKFGKPGQI
jgi:hypothetical protein